MKNHPEKRFYQQKKQDADTSGEGLRFGAWSPSHTRWPFPRPLSEHRAPRALRDRACRSRPGLRHPAHSDPPASLGDNVLFCFDFISCDKAYVFRLRFWPRAIGTQLSTRGRERRVPAGTHRVSWLNCYPNSPGHSAPQIIFP